MKRGKTRLLLPIFAAAALLLLNVLVFYYVNCTGEYMQTSDIYGRQQSESRTENRRLEEILSPGVSREMIESRLAGYEEIINAVTIIESIRGAELDKAKNIVSEYSKSHGNIGVAEITAQVLAEKKIYEAALKKLEYVSDYGSYIRSIEENAEKMSDISLFADGKWINNNIIKTQKDFYGLENISLTVTKDNALGMLVNYHISDFFALLTVFLIIPFFSDFSSGIKSSLSPNRKLLIWPVVIALLLSAAIYISDFLMTGKYVGKIPYNAAVQSYEAFRSCPYTVSVGLFLLVCMIAKLIGVLVFSLLLLFILSTLKHSETDSKADKTQGIFLTAIMLLFIAFSAIAHFYGAFGMVLQEINIFSLFSFERFFIRYLNLDIMGLAVSRLPVQLTVSVFITVLFFIIVHQSVLRFVRSARETAEQNYYDEINRRYTESRKIKHDINNHLLAVSRLIESGNIEGAQKYISEVAEKTELSAQPVKTGSDVLDALLYKKSGQAEAGGIKLEIEITAPVPKTVSDYDLCTIFGNILDNAFEALGNGEVEKQVKLRMSGQHEMYYISCENPFSGELRRENGRILTRKNDKESHGYGLSRVSEIAAKYGGTINISDKDGVFMIEILLN